MKTNVELAAKLSFSILEKKLNICITAHAPAKSATEGETAEREER